MLYKVLNIRQNNLAVTLLLNSNGYYSLYLKEFNYQKAKYRLFYLKA